MITTTVRRTKTLSVPAVVKSLAARLERGLVAAGERLLEESRPLVPQDTTMLQNDGHVRQSGSGLGTRVIVGYGTPGVAGYVFSPKENRMVYREPHKYAIFAHEDPETKHTKGQKDFLREPALTKQLEIRQAFRDAL